MPTREQLCNRLREAGFRFKRQADRTMLWRRGVDRIFVPRRNDISDEATRSILRQAGLTEPEIEAFLRAANG